MIGAPLIQLHEAYRLAVCRPEGCFDAEFCESLLLVLREMEVREKKPFNRLLDLNRLSEIRLHGDEIREIASSRRFCSKELSPVRTAILAQGALCYGIARMYEALMDGSSIEVGVYREPSQAAKWLGVQVSVIQTL